MFKRIAFFATAASSQLVLLAAIAAWIASYAAPGTVRLHVSGDPATMRTLRPNVSGAVFLESRQGRLMLFSQAIQVERLVTPANAQVEAYPDVSQPRTGRLNLLYIVEDPQGSRKTRIAFRRSHLGYVPNPHERTESLAGRIGFSVDCVNEPSFHVGTHGWISRASGATAGPFDQPFLIWRRLVLPYWFLVALSLPVPLFWLRANRHSVRWASQGRCTGCGYDLRQSPERCPECGRPARQVGVADARHA